MNSKVVIQKKKGLLNQDSWLMASDSRILQSFASLKENG
jgi:hypothetical protein